MYLVTANEMRKMDQQTIDSFGLPGRILMENAGLGAVRILKNQFKDLAQKKIAILAGRGNNGGDGFVIGRYLSHMGAKVSVYLLANVSTVKGDAEENLKLLTPLNIPVIEIPDASSFENHSIDIRHHDIYIDAIFGTGLKSEVGGIFKTVIEWINNSGKPVFAVDIPSGLNADTGHPNGICIKAHTTATFAYPKIGHVLFPGASYTGNLEIIDIGIPPYIADNVSPAQYTLTADLIKNYFQHRSPDAHKGTTGHLLVISGSSGKTGAAVLTAMSAVRSGAGLVTLGIPASLNPIVESQVIEAMTYPLHDDAQGRLTESSFNNIKDILDGKKCIAIGPGIDVTDETKKLVNKIICECEIPLVIDADGLNCIEGNVSILKKRTSPVILTPHPGEMARLTNTSSSSIQKDRVKCSRDFAQSYNVYLVLKGARTVIAHPNGSIYINPTGNSGMASGGMGDVLTGIIGSFVTQGYTPEAATHMGVYIHGAAADTLSQEYGPVGFIASDIIDALPVEIGEFIS
jgi:NAD(P)H-hydrate epimerase